MAEKMELDSKIVSMADYGTTAENPKVRLVSLPVHSMVIANVLNDISDYSGREAVEEFRFVAPDANILIVDDINTNLIVARGLMVPFKMRIDVCKSGKDAIAMVQETRYDIIFMDHMMPEMDGIETTEKIRALESTDNYYQEVPIIALTANAVSGMKEMFLKNGMNDFLAKPIETAKLNAALEKWLPAEKKKPWTEGEKYTATVIPRHKDLVIEGINIKEGLTMTGGSVENYVDILASFSKDGRQKPAELEDALARNARNSYAVFVHALTSASASIGAAALSLKARDLEDAGKRSDQLFVNAHHKLFITDLEEIVARINAALEEYQGGGTVLTDIEGIRQDLTELKDALDEMEVQTSDQIMRKITALRWEKSLTETFQKIAENIILSDFDEAIGLIDVLLENK
jgi:CheY-like chemotaxis protein/HPt (histidine-containing phosphotransfer) domain-containing protein